MKLLIIKYLVTALIIVVVSEVARRADKLGALIASLPLVTFMVMIWLYVGKADVEKISNHSFYTFWYVLPTLPMFLVLPWLLQKGVNFWLSLLICVAVTVLCFLIAVPFARRLGVELIP